MIKTPGKNTPRNSKRGCLCKNGTYHVDCCDGSLQAQGIGTINITIMAKNQTLQQVTDEGNVTTNKIEVNKSYEQGDNEGHFVELINNANANQNEHSFASLAKNIFDGQNFDITSGQFIHAFFGEAQYNATGLAQNVNGIWGRAENQNLGQINDAYGVVGQVRNTSNGDITKGYGVVGACRNNGTGTITEAVGVYGDILNVDSNGLILSAYSIKAATPFLVNGDINTLYGVFIDEQNPAGSGSINEKYAFYSKSQENSYLKGNLGLGVENPNEKLEVDGNTFINGAVKIISSTLSSITNTIKKGFLIFNSDDNNRPYIHDGTEWHGLAYKNVGYTVANLPAGETGQTAYVTDAANISYRGAVAGSGTETALVFYDGTNWIYH